MKKGSGLLAGTGRRNRCRMQGSTKLGPWTAGHCRLTRSKDWFMYTASLQACSGSLAPATIACAGLLQLYVPGS